MFSFPFPTKEKKRGRVHVTSTSRVVLQQSSPASQFAIVSQSIEQRSTRQQVNRAKSAGAVFLSQLPGREVRQEDVFSKRWEEAYGYRRH